MLLFADFPGFIVFFPVRFGLEDKFQFGLFIWGAIDNSCETHNTGILFKSFTLFLGNNMLLKRLTHHSAMMYGVSGDMFLSIVGPRVYDKKVSEASRRDVRL